MAEEIPLGCARPTGASIGDSGTMETESSNDIIKKEERPMIKVGHKAPDFTAPAYHKGEFINVKLSDYLGKWILLCFYPGDFTFV